ncbi:predicted protein [Pyrenophora tritici-repentis Pt-1C-BFP]|uniref:Uncharacterized protein n=1 Tax=Pyrenophora tritici-repentis (strain Pt-1C-BFP) TaxID=426418 RepID=B2WNS1_PYRTR|nr:uncharacterized protein PTRG_11631 [Pyrenophora tritici-repentis Pt-1C-BFP]EDU44681.1 predicted protein [Pyrenophora tritici-repentis Pt-1C-BFP]
MVFNICWMSSGAVRDSRQRNVDAKCQALIESKVASSLWPWEAMGDHGRPWWPDCDSVAIPLGLCSLSVYTSPIEGSIGSIGGTSQGPLA